jgi:hypothetical protein
MAAKLIAEKCSELGVQLLYEDGRFGGRMSDAKIKRAIYDEWQPQLDAMVGCAYLVAVEDELSYEEAIKTVLVAHPKIAIICRPVPKFGAANEMPGQVSHEYLLLPNVEMFVANANANSCVNLIMISTGPFDSVSGWDVRRMQVAVDRASAIAAKRLLSDSTTQVEAPDWKVAPLAAALVRTSGRKN